MSSSGFTAIIAASDAGSSSLRAGEGTRESLNVREKRLQDRAALERFLADVERRAFRMARLAVRDTDDALDLVQDAMLKLVRHYAAASPAEWPLLFFRILHNGIRDHRRRSAFRNRVLAFFTGDDAADRLAELPDPAAEDPPERAALGAALTALEAAVAALTARQREAFLLRALEELDVAETAVVMGCSEGSVKTHYSRAVHSLRATLGEHWP